jgi:hypothetical protein
MHTFHALASFLVLASLTLVPLRANAEAPGQKVFTEYKCNKCHTVDSAKIARTKEPKKGDKEPPDLSGVGAKHERSWIEGYIQKQQEKDGKKHKVKFRGDANETKALLDWLTSLKTPAKK